MSSTHKEYTDSYNSFSGCDIVASISINGYNPMVVGELQTISYSIHREVLPVRTLGRINPLGFVSGPRTIAGSLIFTVFNKNLVYEMLQYIKNLEGTGNEPLGGLRTAEDKTIIGNYVMDEMPPFDVTITMMNEYGQMAGLSIKGIVIVDEGQVMSIEDLLTENTMSYMAQDIQVLNSLETNWVPGVSAKLKQEDILPPVESRPDSGTHVGPLQVDFFCADSQAEIYYTLDGSEPSKEAYLLGRASLYLDSHVITLNPNFTIEIKAIAIRGNKRSVISTFTYKILPR